MRRRGHGRKTRLVWLFVAALLGLMSVQPALVAGSETWQFERLWPTLQQPWYFSAPWDVTVDSAGHVYVVDSRNNRIQKFTADGQFITRWGRAGKGRGEFDQPWGIAVDSYSHIYVTDHYNHRIQKFRADGRFLKEWGHFGEGAGELYFPCGLAVDHQGNVYVADSENNRIQKFTSEGKLITQWGGYGTADGEFHWPEGVAVDGRGNVYVVDTENNRIQKFTSEGQFITKWGRYGEDSGEFHAPKDIAVDAHGNVYVADTEYCLIQKFTSDGKFIKRWGGWGDAEGKFRYPCGIATDTEGQLHVVDYGNHRLQKFTLGGRFIAKWGSTGIGGGFFDIPGYLAMDDQDHVYVVDTANNRIQKFSALGELITVWGTYGPDQGQFDTPGGIAIDAQGNVYVADSYNHRIQKFNNNGDLLREWGRYGHGDGEFHRPEGITIDSDNHVYVTEYYNCRIQEFTSEGELVSKWGQEGQGPGQFLNPKGITLDGNGHVYVVDCGNNRIQKFTSTGGFIAEWGKTGSGAGELHSPSSIGIDSEGNIHVTDTDNDRIQVFTPDGRFIGKWGRFGTDAGQLNHPGGLAVSRDGIVYVADSSNNRIQTFKKSSVHSSSKAIIVAGGGPYAGNTLWDATELSANFAYRTLTYQGFTKASITYLSSDTRLDLDSNGLADDVDGDATNANLKHALTAWARGAGDVVLYLVDHGGTGTFTMKGGKETLSATDLASWLDDLEPSISGQILIVHDACHSGSFLAPLTASGSTKRIVISSTSPEESAYFVNRGSISFSNYFWTHVFNGLDLADSFSSASQAISFTSKQQHPLLDADGNGEGNQAEDLTLAQGRYIGNGTKQFGEGPKIGNVCPEQTIHKTQALLYADGVTSDDGIARVWAMVRPPDFAPPPTGNPVSALPTLDLLQAGSDPGHYEATYTRFNTSGTYQIAIYAMDRIGNISIPKLTSISVDSPLTRKAILVAGGAPADPIWPGIEKGLKAAYEALKYQGYTREDIYLLSPASIPGVEKDAVLPNLSNFRFAIQSWASDQTQDLVLYLVGNGANRSFAINSKEELAAIDLKDWLDGLQASLPGPVTMVYDASLSGSFLATLVPAEGQKRITIASTGKKGQACFASDGELSFSRFFWNQVTNGATVRECFVQAAISIGSISPQQVASLDDSGNGIGNERGDGELARQTVLGTGVVLAGDAPVIGSICAKQELNGKTSATLWVKDITATAPLTKVWAVITPPHSRSGSRSGPLTDLPTLILKPSGSDAAPRYQATCKRFTAAGTYNIAILAQDRNGNVSTPKQTSVTQSRGKAPRK